MLKFGPVDVIVLAAGEPRFDGSILAELEKAAATGTIRVLDAMLLTKDDAGDCWRVDIEDLPEDDKAALAFVETGTRVATCCQNERLDNPTSELKTWIDHILVRPKLRVLRSEVIGNRRSDRVDVSVTAALARGDTRVAWR